VLASAIGEARPENWAKYIVMQREAKAPLEPVRKARRAQTPCCARAMSYARMSYPRMSHPKMNASSAAFAQAHHFDRLISTGCPGALWRIGPYFQCRKRRRCRRRCRQTQG
jgi:hypothetical protein